MRLVAVVLLAATLAGCAGGVADDPSASPTPSVTATASGTGSTCHPSYWTCDCPADHYPTSVGCVAYPHLMLEVASDAALVVDVPFPHGQHCLSQDDWMQAKRSAENATLTAATVDQGGIHGQTLRVTFVAAGVLRLLVNVTDRPTCQTLRHDPWSVDPDPSDGNLTVLADRAGVTVRVDAEEGGACATRDRFQGSVRAGDWTVLPGARVPTSCA